MKQRPLLWAFGAVLILGLVWVGVSGWQKWNQPLGPSLGLATPTALPASATPLASSSAASSPALTLAPTEAPLCGGPAAMILLAVGADNRDNTYLYGLADVIRIVRVDFITPMVTVLSLPRDLWVQIPGISDHYGITDGKLNQAYFYGNPGVGYYDGAGAGPGLLARTLALNFGITPDHYLAVNMQTFVRVVDAVGGIDLVLDAPVDGRPVDDHTEDMGYFPAGPHHFTGDEALRFSRIRKVDNAFHREDRQNQVLCALRKKVLSPSVLGDIPQILAAFQDSVLTDLSLSQMGQLACLAPQVSQDNLRMEGLPQEWLTSTRVYDPRLRNTTFVLDVDFQAVRDLAADFLAGTWPVSDDGQACE
ncbi:MAG: LCP family protein [Anaerolineales bacterium]